MALESKKVVCAGRFWMSRQRVEVGHVPDEVVPVLEFVQRSELFLLSAALVEA